MSANIEMKSYKSEAALRCPNGEYKNPYTNHVNYWLKGRLEGKGFLQKETEFLLASKKLEAVEK